MQETHNVYIVTVLYMLHNYGMHKLNAQYQIEHCMYHKLQKHMAGWYDSVKELIFYTFM